MTPDVAGGVGAQRQTWACGPPARSRPPRGLGWCNVALTTNRADSKPPASKREAQPPVASRPRSEFTSRQRLPAGTRPAAGAASHQPGLRHSPDPPRTWLHSSLRQRDPGHGIKARHAGRTSETVCRVVDVRRTGLSASATNGGSTTLARDDRLCPPADRDHWLAPKMPRESWPPARPMARVPALSEESPELERHVIDGW